MLVRRSQVPPVDISLPPATGKLIDHACCDGGRRHARLRERSPAHGLSGSGLTGATVRRYGIARAGNGRVRASDVRYAGARWQSRHPPTRASSWGCHSSHVWLRCRVGAAIKRSDTRILCYLPLRPSAGRHQSYRFVIKFTYRLRETLHFSGTSPLASCSLYRTTSSTAEPRLNGDRGGHAEGQPLDATTGRTPVFSKARRC